jgi:hypothetical protein
MIPNRDQGIPKAVGIKSGSRAVSPLDFGIKKK